MEPQPTVQSNEVMIQDIDNELVAIQSRWHYLLQLKYELKYGTKPKTHRNVGQLVIESLE